MAAKNYNTGPKTEFKLSGFGASSEGVARECTRSTLGISVDRVLYDLDEALAQGHFKHPESNWCHGIIKRLQEALEHDASSEGVSGKYNELLFHVGKKYPGETRHETALRYIKEADEGVSRLVYGKQSKTIRKTGAQGEDKGDSGLRMNE